MNFQALIKDFTRSLDQKGRAEATIIAYRKDLEQLFDHIEKNNIKDLKGINTQDIVNFLNDIKERDALTKKTISRKINSIKTFFKYLQLNKKINTNPATNVEHPRSIPNTPRILSSLEYRSIRDTARTNIKYYTIIELILQTGLRISEIAKLQLGDLKLNIHKPILNVKGYSTIPHREIELNPIAVISLNDYLNKLNTKINTNDPLFFTKNKGPILIRNLRSSLERIFSKAGIKGVTVNDLRNTFILYQLEAGLPIEKVAQIVGHKRIATTERYLKLLEKQPDKTQKEITPL